MHVVLMAHAQGKIADRFQTACESAKLNSCSHLSARFLARKQPFMRARSKALTCVSTRVISMLCTNINVLTSSQVMQLNAHKICAYLCLNHARKRIHLPEKYALKYTTVNA